MKCPECKIQMEEKCSITSDELVYTTYRCSKCGYTEQNEP